MSEEEGFMLFWAGLSIIASMITAKFIFILKSYSRFQFSHNHAIALTIEIKKNEPEGRMIWSDC